LDDNKYTFIEAKEEKGVEVKTYIKKLFRVGKDAIYTSTFGCRGYDIDIETGKVTFTFQDK
jgi:hypothetical protein